jgi:predicted metal-binding protein
MFVHILSLQNHERGERMEKYIQFARELHMIDAMIISPRQISFDIRAILKCRWGCEDSRPENIRCDHRGTTYQERVEMVKRYNHILIVHSHDARELSKAVLEIERTAFLDGYTFAFAIRTCNLCEICSIKQGNPCPSPDKIRPCDSIFGMDVYKTVRNLGLPCEVLKTKDDVQNRYGFVLLD